MVVCDECGKPIRRPLCFARWHNGKFVYICKRCSRAMVDEHNTNGLMMAWIDRDCLNDPAEDPDDFDYEFEIQAARKGEE